jgi:hypothetical protein
MVVTKHSQQPLHSSQQHSTAGRKYYALGKYKPERVFNGMIKIQTLYVRFSENIFLINERRRKNILFRVTVISQPLNDTEVHKSLAQRRLLLRFGFIFGDFPSKTKS